jgi:hypothetical protein
MARASWPSADGKTYESIYLRESYRDDFVMDVLKR